MDRVRVVHFADLHLGVEAGGRPNPDSGLNQRVHDVLDRFDELCAYCESEAVDAVLFAGDAYKHQHPTPTLQKLFAERVRRLARSGIGVFLLVGNHDLPKMSAHAHPFGIYDALEVDNVVVGERAQLYDLPLRGGGSLQVGALPHFSRAQALARLGEELTPEQADAAIQRSVDKVVRGLGDAVDPSRPAVFCGHCHVNQAEISASAQSLFGIAELEVTLSSLSSSGAFAYYAIGHVHKRQVLRTDPFVAYSGSLERVDFSEGQTLRVAGGSARLSDAEAKGFYSFDLERSGDRWHLGGEPSFREVGARAFVTVRVDDDATDDPTATVTGALATARDKGATFGGAFVKVVASLDTSDRARLSHKAVRAAVPEAYDVRLQVDVRDDASRVRDPRFAVRMTELEALRHYVDSRDDWADDRDELLRVGGRLIAEVTS